MPSLVLASSFSGLTGPAEAFVLNTHGEFPDEEDELPSILVPYDLHEGYPQPHELPPSASATEVVRAWSMRLQDVYEQCNPQVLPALAREPSRMSLLFA